MEVTYCLLVVLLGVLVYKGVRSLRELHQQDSGPLLLYYKPTGKVIVMPRHYESEAVEQFLRDLEELPCQVNLDSPDFQVL